ncbi:oxygen-independent coproporphyrinogen III oxidase [Neptunicella marina]|uniref:Coproporphyrinogen-III oxidase n=1 Tax=Neptunicella marina TaxID=2125989 RepID=A0A8J6IRK7_9ALTE|nr:oxygen-independent coproporphyrinogen III oxidase [Neptunicella marina]MBC3764505.1 oxygen-independent coproporphyrinogen III oxidase [Neptunicella marina]
MSYKPLINPDVLARYNANGPRYTSYPTALEFHEDFDYFDRIEAVKQSTSQDLSLYVHIPFCHSLCYYCGCNKIVTRHSHKADQYLDALIQEIKSLSQAYIRYSVRQLHLGGGTPSFLTQKQMARLLSAIRQHFNVVDDIEMSIEIDPRRLPDNYMAELAELGFNRLSIGVQDTNTDVQLAINRVQDTAYITGLVKKARELGINSVNLDLIYGLPMQSTTGFAKTLSDVIAMDPDRISLFSYAHLPSRFAAQRKIKDAWLPDAKTKLALMEQAINVFTRAGYQFIGMDHFAKPEDELAVAQRQGRLNRNFQGYTTTADCDLLGLGVSSISAVGPSYSQNVKTLAEYYQLIADQGHALERGVTLTQDDKIRRWVISQLMCNFQLNTDIFRQHFALEFAEYFSDELKSLSEFIQDDLITVSEKGIVVEPQAKLLIRSICMKFDTYRQQQQELRQFSKVI